jgi:hypothetical protein
MLPILLSLHLACQQPPSSADGGEPGLTLRLFSLEQPPAELPRLVPGQTPNVDLVVPLADLGVDDFGGVAAPHYSQLLGWLRVESGGEHRFRLTSDDGSRLTLDGQRVIDNDGRHSMVAAESGAVELGPGAHELLIEHFDSGGNRGLLLEWVRPGESRFEPVPATALRCETDPTRVTSPGFKAVVDDRRPGFGMPLESAHPGWRVETIRPEGFEALVGSMAFLPDGRLAFGTFDPLQRDEENLPDIDSKSPDTIWALDVESGELNAIATDVFEPTGLCVVDGVLYVAHRRSVERLIDRDGDGFLETHQRVAEGWEGWNYHQFAFGLVHRHGKLYTALSTSMAPPKWEGMGTNAGPNGPLRGSVLEIDLATGDVTAIAGGTRTPNGLGWYRGRLLYTDNQGAWFPASALSEVVPGRFYGHHNRTNLVPKLADRFPDGGFPSVYSDRPPSPPALWLPHGEASNSPTTPLEIAEGPFAGQLLIGELTAGGVRRAFLEEVDGALQGAVFRFTQGLESGVNRMQWGPDGALYVGGIGAGGNWNWNGTRYGLQRLVPTGDSAFELHSVEAIPGGFRVRFTEPVSTAELRDLARYGAQSWTYAPTAAYGGPKVDVREHRVTSVEPGEDGRSVEVGLDGLEPGRCLHLTFDLHSREGAALWSGECWYTLNRLPLGREPGTGLGAEPGQAGAWLLVGGNGASLADTERPENLSADEAAFGRSALRIGPGEELRTRSLIGGPSLAGFDLHLELRSAGDDSPAGSLEVRWGESVFAVTADRIGQRWTAVDLRMHATGAWLSAQYDGGSVVERIDNPEVTGSLASPRLEALAFAVRGGGAVELRDVWVSPHSDPDPVRVGAWRDLLADPEALVARGGAAEYRFESGSLFGETRPNTPNTFMTTRERYADFELVFEVRLDPELNSGVQIRSEVQGGFEHRTGGLEGYQVELDPSGRSWSGGIYDERGRGWLHPLHSQPSARRAWRQGQWNRVRVVADGPLIRTWVNGVPASELIDGARAEGHIGFQVHGVGGRVEPLTVEWRDVRLRELR